MLSAAEQQRYGRIRAPRRQREYLAGHFLVREALTCLLPGWRASHRLELDGQQLRVHGPQASAVDVNLSHSGDWVACLAGVNTRVGVDVEMPRRPRNCLELASEFFAEGEFQQLQALPAEQRASAFYRLWTLKESHLKARRSGISAVELAREFVPLDGEPGFKPPFKKPGLLQGVTDWFSYSFSVASAGRAQASGCAATLFGAITLSAPLSVPLAVQEYTLRDAGQSPRSPLTSIAPRAFRAR
ncbi:hypothetical protein GCM10027217_02810 [Pseudomaricurvus hydrocarbonicus]